MELIRVGTSYHHMTGENQPSHGASDQEHWRKPTKCPTRDIKKEPDAGEHQPSVVPIDVGEHQPHTDSRSTTQIQ